MDSQESYWPSGIGPCPGDMPAGKPMGGIEVPYVLEDQSYGPGAITQTPVILTLVGSRSKTR